MLLYAVPRVQVCSSNTIFFLEKRMTSRKFKPSPAFKKKEEQVRQSILLETKEKLRTDMEKLFDDPQHCDAMIVSEFNELPVHSFMLKARLPELYLYMQDQPESSKIKITDVSLPEIKQWVKALYSEDKINRVFIEKALPELNKKTDRSKRTNVEGVSLSSDLLSLFNESSTSDVEFCVGGNTIRAHKAILASRSDYFGAMFSSSWSEASQSSVSIPDVSYEIFHGILKFIYGASQDVLNFPVSKVLRVADMYGMQDLVDLIVVEIKITKCHLFHKPCAYCIPQVYECLKLCEAFYRTESFQLQCIEWISKNFDKTLASRHFPQMSEHFQTDVRQNIQRQLSSSTVAVTWLKCNSLIASLKNLNTSWTETVVNFLEEIRELCLKVTAENFNAVCELPAISVFIKESNNSKSLLEQFLNEVLERLTIPNCSYILLALQKVIDTVMAMDESESHFCDPFDAESLQVVQECVKRCEKFIVGRIGPVSKTKAWKNISSSKQKELKSSAFFVDL